MHTTDTSTPNERFQQLLTHTELTVALKRAAQEISAIRPTLDQLQALSQAYHALAKHVAKMTWTHLSPGLHTTRDSPQPAIWQGLRPDGPHRDRPNGSTEADSAPPPDPTPPPDPPQLRICLTSLEPLETSEQSSPPA